MLLLAEIAAEIYRDAVFLSNAVAAVAVAVLVAAGARQGVCFGNGSSRRYPENCEGKRKSKFSSGRFLRSFTPVGAAAAAAVLLCVAASCEHFKPRLADINISEERCCFCCGDSSSRYCSSRC